MRNKKKNNSIPQPLNEAYELVEITRLQFLKQPTHYVYKLKSGKVFRIKVGEDYVELHPMLR